MPTYLYCLVPRGGVGEPQSAFPPGIASSTVRVLTAGAVDAWVSTIDDRLPLPTTIAVREHDAVVTAALATGRTPLPARFGQTWASDADCVLCVERRTTELTRLLDRVAGLVEMTVCTRLPGVPSSLPAADTSLPGAGPGTTYLRQLRARSDRERHARAELDTLRGRLHRRVASLSRGELGEIRGTDESLALSISYLVERGDEARFGRAVDEVARETTACLVVVGPRAPYSFISPSAQRPSHRDGRRALDGS